MIYIVKHKPYNTPKLDGYMDLYVGDMYQGNLPFNKYNPYLNETTAMYDIVASGDEIIGLVHYRRMFDGLTFSQAKEILREYDIITTHDHNPETPYKHLTDNLNKAVVDKYLFQLEQEVQDWFFEHHEFNVCNMFVGRTDFLDGYLGFINPVLRMTDQFIAEDLSRKRKHNRTLGYICECLFGYYCKDFKRYKMKIKDI